MRILTFLVDGQPRLGALVRNQVVDIAAVQAARARVAAVRSRICGH